MVRSWVTALAVGAVTVFLLVQTASAQRLSTRGYGRADGLSNLDNYCLIQTSRGAILVCSEDGLFAYTAHHFTALGPEQGLPDGEVVEDLLQTGDGALYVRYADSLYVSEDDVSGKAPETLRFRPVQVDGRFFNDGRKQMVAWSGGVALIANGSIFNVKRDHGHFRVVPIAPPELDRVPFRLFGSLRAVRGDLWLITDDNKVCRIAPGALACFGPSSGLPNVAWHDVTAGDGRTLLVRSDDAIAELDPVTGHVTMHPLPGQADWPHTARIFLGFFRDAEGHLMTQGGSGLIVQTTSGWRSLSFADLPGGPPISAVLTDRDGQLWIDFYSRGVFRVLGYGEWDSIDRTLGLSDALAWGTVRDLQGHLWVTTDSGLDEFDDDEVETRKMRTFPGGTYAIAKGPDGRIWAGARSEIEAVDPATGAVERIKSSFVSGLATEGRRLWVGTGDGLFAIDAGRGQPAVLRRVSPGRTEVTSLAPDGAGGLWFTAGTTLMHVGAQGVTTTVKDRWPAGAFQPSCIAFANDTLWIGGSGGLYRLGMTNGRITSSVRFDASQIGDNAVLAVHVDRSGRVWVGTGNGVSAYDGTRWVSADTTTGLVWDDVSQNGISEDPDGTIWVATGNGLSHLLHPERLFQTAAPDVALQDVRLGGRRLTGGRVPFTTAPLTLTLGTTDYASEDQIRFRYRMTGVDGDWVNATSAQIRYASVPPGTHTLIVGADNPLTHLSAMTQSIRITMGWPWWKRWWAELGEGLLAIGTVCAAASWHTARYERNQRQLERLVVLRTRELEIRTDEIEQARRRVEDQATLLQKQAAALRLQTMRDGLTGLLNRVTIERQLAETLRATDQRRECAVALLDIDHFKQINDRHGHLRGDQVLRDAARRIAGQLGPKDAAGRYGGEEFIVVLDDRDGRAAERLLALHERIRGECFLIGETPERVTVSIGLAWLRPNDGWESLVGRADKALYAAKRAGRDRIVEEETPRPRRATVDGPSRA